MLRNIAFGVGLVEDCAYGGAMPFHIAKPEIPLREINRGEQCRFASPKYYPSETSFVKPPWLRPLPNKNFNPATVNQTPAGVSAIEQSGIESNR
jgi:hypothetical protein